jgi:hypothetical protein
MLSGVAGFGDADQQVAESLVHSARRRFDEEGGDHGHLRIRNSALITMALQETQ